MNFLSHLFLAGDDEGLIIGNFIADSVKGSALNNYDPAIQRGIILHRKIDSFTDSHSITDLSKERLRPQYRKYAGVIVDIFYDHFLSLNWQQYSNESMKLFTDRIYAVIHAHEAVLPPQSLRFSRYMMYYDMLRAYGKIEGVSQALQGLAARARFISNMEHAAADLQRDYDLYQQEFRDFFPELQRFVKDEISRL